MEGNVEPEGETRHSQIYRFEKNRKKKKTSRKVKVTSLGKCHFFIDTHIIMFTLK